MTGQTVRLRFTRDALSRCCSSGHLCPGLNPVWSRGHVTGAPAAPSCLWQGGGKRCSEQPCLCHLRAASRCLVLPTEDTRQRLPVGLSRDHIK